MNAVIHKRERLATGFQVLCPLGPKRSWAEVHFSSIHIGGSICSQVKPKASFHPEIISLKVTKKADKNVSKHFAAQTKQKHVVVLCQHSLQVVDTVLKLEDSRTEPV